MSCRASNSGGITPPMVRIHLAKEARANLIGKTPSCSRQTLSTSSNLSWNAQTPSGRRKGFLFCAKVYQGADEANQILRTQRAIGFEIPRTLVSNWRRNPLGVSPVEARRPQIPRIEEFIGDRVQKTGWLLHRITTRRGESQKRIA